jgi:hypothetical protein
VVNQVADNGRHPGAVTVSGCTYLHSNKHGPATYRCTGGFAAGDRTFTGPPISFDREDSLPTATRRR